MCERMRALIWFTGLDRVQGRAVANKQAARLREVVVLVFPRSWLAVIVHAFFLPVECNQANGWN